MKTVYTNTRHPKLLKWIYGILLSIWLAANVLVIVLDSSDSKYFNFVIHLCWALLPTIIICFDYYLRQYTIDTDADILTARKNDKYPIKISKVATVTYKESKKGRFRSLLVHDDGIGFMDIRTSKKNADLIVEELVKTNPAIEVKHTNYIF